MLNLRNLLSNEPSEPRQTQRFRSPRFRSPQRNRNEVETRVLPPNWIRNVSENVDRGRPYYVNELTNQSQWHFPNHADELRRQEYQRLEDDVFRSAQAERQARNQREDERPARIKRNKVLVDMMLARERHNRHAPTDVEVDGCTELAAELASLPSLPLEMIADAMAKLGCANVHNKYSPVTDDTEIEQATHSDLVVENGKKLEKTYRPEFVVHCYKGHFFLIEKDDGKKMLSNATESVKEIEMDIEEGIKTSNGDNQLIIFINNKVKRIDIDVTKE